MDMIELLETKVNKEKNHIMVQFLEKEVSVELQQFIESKLDEYTAAINREYQIKTGHGVINVNHYLNGGYLIGFKTELPPLFPIKDLEERKKEFSSRLNQSFPIYYDDLKKQFRN